MSSTDLLPGSVIKLGNYFSRNLFIRSFEKGLLFRKRGEVDAAIDEADSAGAASRLASVSGGERPGPREDSVPDSARPLMRSTSCLKAFQGLPSSDAVEDESAAPALRPRLAGACSPVVSFSPPA